MCIIRHDDSDNKITYVNSTRVGAPERRTHGLSDLRTLMDAAIELKDAVIRQRDLIKEAWPADYPVPQEVDVLLAQSQRIVEFSEFAIARARKGMLRVLGEHADG